jgi:hypothetical protein
MGDFDLLMLVGTCVIVYFGAGVALAIVVYHKDAVGLKNLDNVFWYRVVRASILAYTFLFGPAVVVTFVILYILAAMAMGLVELVYLLFTWEKSSESS